MIEQIIVLSFFGIAATLVIGLGLIAILFTPSEEEAEEEESFDPNLNTTIQSVNTVIQNTATTIINS